MEHDQSRSMLLAPDGLSAPNQRAAETQVSENNAVMAIGSSKNFMLQYGRRLADNGYCVIPIQPKSKCPGVFAPGRGWTGLPNWTQYLSAPASSKTIDLWSRAPAGGVGILTGELVAIDIDVDDQGTARKVTEVIERHLGESELVRVGRAPRCIRLYRTDAPFKKIQMGPIECLAQGQQFVAFGLHATTGKPYEWPQKCPLDMHISNLPSVSEDQVRAAMAEAYAILPNAMKSKQLPLEGLGQHKPSDELRGTPEAIAACLHRIPNDDLAWDDWNRVGMATFCASSGSGYDLFEKWSANSRKFDLVTTRAKWDSYSRSKPHSIGMGTLVKLAQELGETPIPPEIPFNEKKRGAAVFDISGLLAGAEGAVAPSVTDKAGDAEQDNVPADVSAPPPAQAHTDPITPVSGVSDNSDRSRREEKFPYDPVAWGAPDFNYLGSGRQPAPPFPTHVLGEFVAEWASETAAGRCAPVDYVACSLLAVAASAIGNTRWPQATPNWREPPHLWMALVGDPSSGKSPGMKASTRLAEEIERRAGSGAASAAKKYEEALSVAHVHRKQWLKEVKAASAKDEPTPAMPEKAIYPDRPIRTRYLIGDTTPEALADLLSHQPRGLLVVRDELAGLVGSFNRYSNGTGERAMWLEAYVGGAYSIDRKHAPPTYIQRLALGIVGGIQPERMATIQDGPDDGLIARFLWCWPEPAINIKLVDFAAPDEDAQMIIQRLYDLKLVPDEERGGYSPQFVPLDASARNTLEAYMQSVNERCRLATGAFAGALGKVRGQALRLSLVLEYLKWASKTGFPEEPTFISDSSMKSAIELMESYFLPMARRALAQASLPAEDCRGIILAKHLKHTGTRAFNASNLRYVVNELRESKKMEEACTTLSKAGLIQPKVRLGGAKGRRRLDFEVNEALHTYSPD